MLRKKVPAYYRKCAQLEATLERYKSAKKEVIENLRDVNHLISNIEGKLEGLDTALDGDRRLEVTLLRGYHFYEYGLSVVDKKEAKEIMGSIEQYNSYVKEEEFTFAKETLLELQKLMLHLRLDKALLFNIGNDEMEKKAHTPIVIREKKRVQ